MPDMRDPRSVLDAAEQAANAGDYPLAEQLLREAVVLLEDRLGPLHPDLANALNNLGVVCEITEKPTDAEHYFRRAYAIATASLAPDHPFVAMSRKNLEDFCSVRGRTIDSPPIASIVDDPVASAAALREFPPEHPATADRAQEPFDLRAAVSTESRPVASGRTPGLFSIGAPIAGGLLLLLIATLLWFRSNDGVESPPGTPSVATESPSVSTESPATKAAPPPAEPIDDAPTAAAPPPEPIVSDPPTVAAPPAVATPDAPRETETTAESESPTAAAQPLVVSAQLCRDFSTGGTRGEWECTPLDVPAGPGALVFYTRLESATATTVQHRWYRGDTLHQTVQLRIGANTTGGYRTYSRQTVQGAGEWRVELRSSDGVVLHEERFVVR